MDRHLESIQRKNQEQELNGMERPYIICHMTTSIDGKVTGAFLNTPEGVAASEVYYEINRGLQGDAYACGRITMEGSFTGGWYPDLAPFEGVQVPDGDYIAAPDARFFAVAFDRRGRLGWKSGQIEDDDPGYGGAHIIEVLCADAPPAYLAYLRSIGVSYLVAGEGEMDLPLALEKLKRLFGIETLLLEGGSVLNGAFLRENVVDELSLVVAPVTSQADGLPLFDEGVTAKFRLNAVSDYEDILCLRYRLDSDP